MEAARLGARRRLAIAAGTAAVLLCAACGSGNGTAEEPGSPDTSGASGTTSSDPTTTSAVPTVDPPGPLEDRIYGDDLLIVSQDTIPDDLVEQILAVKVDGKAGIEAAERLSVGQISVENKLYNIGAVDPSTYRRFTPENYAQTEDGWDRVASGEIALDVAIQDRVPLDKDDYLEAGSGDITHPIHVGFYVENVGTLDGVVNTAWGDRLGLPADNALIINTGIASPQAVRTQIEKLLGDQEMSITALDIVAEAGIDLETFQTVIPVGSFADAVGVFRYTPIGGGRIAPDPKWVREHIVTETVPILGQVTCNKHMMPQLKAALAEIQRVGLADEINPGEYAGCYYPRFIAGSTQLSNHSFGLALDLNVPGNQRGTVGEMDRGVVAIFKNWGFAWGGDWNYTDPMHFEMARIVNPA